VGWFKDIASEVEFGAQEHGVIELWKKLGTFSRSVSQRSGAPEFIFYDGPPFATGLPHYGHLVASTLKDIVPRYWTMRGFRVERRFGWDTHGLPIEMQVERNLNLNGPQSIRAFGVDKFNEACRGSVLTYVEEWRRTVTRIGRWVDFDHDYKTMDPSFMESVWWVFAELWKKGLVYQGFRVMPYSWRLSTALSNFEAGLDYRDVDDPALTVRLALDAPLAGKKAFLLIWTTTPWTLPSNLGVAVKDDIEYVVADHEDGHRYVVAKDLLAATLQDKATVITTVMGKDLIGKTYVPLFPFFANRKQSGAFRVIHSDHVTTTDGTGLVHMAPAFGEDDFEACRKNGIEFVDPVDPEGNFGPEVRPYQGKNVKEADKLIIHDLKAQGAIFKHAQIRHPYPYCYRSGTPLIYKTTPSWYVKVEPLRDRMVANNRTIHWVPEFVGAARFENWLKEARDWSISRSRFWGTPIPLWMSEDQREMHCVASVGELEQLTGTKVTDLHPHRIDHLTFTKNGKTLRRIPDVFDCWFESGAMPYAQLHYPFENKAFFEQAFPAQFIAEGLDQTRGWFYTLLVLSTALFEKAPFRNVIVNGLVLAESGEKMSKSKRNYPDPNDVIERYGADALRAYLINSPLVRAEPLKFTENHVKEVVRTVLLPLQNAWGFFVTYANLDGWNPKTHLAQAPALAERPELDRWIVSVLQSLVREINTQMEGYYLDRVVPPMLGFIDDLTNWYIRRSRRRFWKSGNSTDKASAYATLYDVLTTFSKVIAPVLPFFAERMHQNLVVEPGMGQPTEDSVHLCAYPLPEEPRIDRGVEAAMASVRQTVALGRALRERHKLKTRQPLSTLTVVSTDATVRQALMDHAELLEDELNVKQVVALADDAALATLTLKANFKTLGKKMGVKMKDAATDIAALTRAQWATLESGGSLSVQGVNITKEDVLVTRSALGEVVVESSGDLTVAFDTKVTDELRREGLMRETVSRLQKMRKDLGLEVSDRIVLSLGTGDEELTACFREHEERIKDEVLAVTMRVANQGEGETLDIDGHTVTVLIQKTTA
jgi:isoleucyl-tRNA synthetase